VQGYVLELLGSDRTRGVEWLERLQAEARPQAIAGEKYAQSVMGSIETWRCWWGLAPAAESLERALEWFVMAARQVGGERMIDQVRLFYLEARRRGLRFPSVESFLADPEIAHRYREHFGTTL
jgi:hypothetical protein